MWWNRTTQELHFADWSKDKDRCFFGDRTLIGTRPFAFNSGQTVAADGWRLYTLRIGQYFVGSVLVCGLRIECTCGWFDIVIVFPTLKGRGLGLTWQWTTEGKRPGAAFVCSSSRVVRYKETKGWNSASPIDNHRALWVFTWYISEDIRFDSVARWRKMRKVCQSWRIYNREKIFLNKRRNDGYICHWMKNKQVSTLVVVAWRWAPKCAHAPCVDIGLASL